MSSLIWYVLVATSATTFLLHSTGGSILTKKSITAEGKSTEESLPEDKGDPTKETANEDGTPIETGGTTEEEALQGLATKVEAPKEIMNEKNACQCQSSNCFCQFKAKRANKTTPSDTRIDFGFNALNPSIEITITVDDVSSSMSLGGLGFLSELCLPFLPTKLDLCVSIGECKITLEEIKISLNIEIKDSGVGFVTTEFSFKITSKEIKICFNLKLQNSNKSGFVDLEIICYPIPLHIEKMKFIASLANEFMEVWIKSFTDVINADKIMNTLNETQQNLEYAKNVVENATNIAIKEAEKTFDDVNKFLKKAVSDVGFNIDKSPSHNVSDTEKKSEEIGGDFTDPFYSLWWCC